MYASVLKWDICTFFFKSWVRSYFNAIYHTQHRKSVSYLACVNLNMKIIISICISSGSTTLSIKFKVVPETWYFVKIDILTGRQSDRWTERQTGPTH